MSITNNYGKNFQLQYSVQPGITGRVTNLSGSNTEVENANNPSYQPGTNQGQSSITYTPRPRKVCSSQQGDVACETSSGSGDVVCGSGSGSGDVVCGSGAGSGTWTDEKESTLKSLLYRISDLNFNIDNLNAMVKNYNEALRMLQRQYARTSSDTIKKQIDEFNEKLDKALEELEKLKRERDKLTWQANNLARERMEYRQNHPELGPIFEYE